MKFPNFNGKHKFRPSGEMIKHISQYTNEVTYKEGFIPTKQYAKYLKLKYEYERMQEIEQLRRSIEYQEEHYGEADKVDLTRYQIMLGIKVTR